MSILGDQVRNADSSFFKAGEQITSVDFGFAEGAADSKNHALIVEAHSAGNRGSRRRSGRRFLEGNGFAISEIHRRIVCGGLKPGPR